MSIETLEKVPPVLSPDPMRDYHPPAGGWRLPACFAYRLRSPTVTYVVVETSLEGAPVRRTKVANGEWIPRPKGIGPWWIEATGVLGGDPTPLAVDVELATELDDALPSGAANGSDASPVPVSVLSQAAPFQVSAAAAFPVTDALEAQTLAKPAAGGSGSIGLNAADQNVATTPGTILELVALGGSAFVAIDTDSTVAADRMLVLANERVKVRAGNALHATQGPAAGGTLYYAQRA